MQSRLWGVEAAAPIHCRRNLSAQRHGMLLLLACEL